jgi:ABC-type lipoprotein export system ATPase subunit
MKKGEIKFEIKNLECRYSNATHSVLKIDDLIINCGEIVFFIGSSGVGKSTVLETLGLMNNTIYSNEDSEINFYSNQTNTPTDYLKVWSESDSEISKRRSENFSFIFQNTNLFPSLTALDNVKIAKSLQQKKDEGNSDAIIIKELSKIFPFVAVKEIIGEMAMLDEDGLPITRKGKPVYQPPKMISEMSGGQRQRLAFVRAISSEYSVLFADEPTGNLDEGNAASLMKILTDDVLEKNNTAVIVSHDLRLAVKCASKIVFIDKINNRDEKASFQYGLISTGQTYITKDNDVWESSDGSSRSITSHKLIDLLSKKITIQSK